MVNDVTEITNLDSQKANTPRWPRKQSFAPNILVMKGGGVKGIAYVGAIQILEKYGYQFNHFVGTSAGAISAALLSVGYSSTELGEILKKTDFRTFKDGYFLTSLLRLPFRKGLYRGEQFRIWLDNYLRQKFPQYSDAIAIRFKHLKNIENASRRLTVFTSTKGRTAYSFDSDDPVNGEDEISFACRCSMAIPYFFIPERIDGQWVVDGGMQNNYPINAILDKFPNLKDSSNFIGLYLGNKKTQRKSEWLLFDIFSIWSESSDEEAKEYFIDRTIVIDPRPVKTTDFSLSPNDVDFLLAEGKASALRWLFHWSEGKRPSKDEVDNAESISADYRGKVIKERRRKLWKKLIILAIALILVITLGINFFNNNLTPSFIKPTDSDPPNTTSPTTHSDLKPRVYFHIKNESQRARAEQLADQLESRSNVFVPDDIQRVDTGPTATELRYFKTTEAPKAEQIADDLSALGVKVLTRYVKGFESSNKIRPWHYELWLSSDGL